MKRGYRLLALFVLFLILISLSFVSASVVAGNKSSEITTNYAPGENLEGWINISLKDESSSSLISNNLNSNSYLLTQLLEDNMLSEDTDYTCIPSGCGTRYTATNGASEKISSLSYGGEKTFSLRVQSSRVNSTNSATFSIEIANEKSCINPAEIDILDDGSIDWKAKDYADEYSCTFESGTGCFNSKESLTEVPIGNIQFCEKIKLTPSKKFSLGAWVKKGNSTWTSSLLTMELYGISGGSRLAFCNLPEPSSSGGEIGCNINYNNPEINDYYVCLKASQTTDYATKTESNNSCGFYATNGISVSSDTIFHDYYIFAKGAPFSNIGSFVFNQAVYDSQKAGGNPATLAQYLSGYITEIYKNNCTNGCAIPIKINAYKGLNVKISNVSVVYSTDASEQTDNLVYDAGSEPGKINSGFISLDLSFLNWAMPEIYGNRTLVLSVGGVNIINQQIYTSQLPIISKVSPTVVSAGVSVLFSVNASSSNKSITKYSWDFGDGEAEIDTSVNSAMHRYSGIGVYTLTVRVQDSSGAESSKEFDIIAGSPKEVLNYTIKKNRDNLNAIRQQIETYPAWYKDAILKESGIDDLDSELKNYERKFGTASSDEEYLSMILNLSALNIPNKIDKSNQGTIPVIVNPENINLDALDKLGAGSYNSELADKYKESIAQWASKSDMTASFFTISYYYDDGIVPLLSYFKLSITPYENRNIENYFVINQEALINSQDVRDAGGEGEISGVRFENLESRDIEFIIIGDVDVNSLPVYISPEFKNLDLAADTGICNNNGKCETGETWKNCRKDCRPVGLTILYIFILVFLAFVSYIILQEWYKRKYESHLFKNRNDLFNIVNFISNALARGLDKKEIENSLRKLGWSSEQITYSFKKVKGKKTGMPFEINLKLPVKTGKK